MGKKQISKRAKKQKNSKKQTKTVQEKSKVTRFQKQIQSELSPKFTEMKSGPRISRFGRPQTETKHDVNSIPGEIAKFIPKHSPKRLKVKDFDPDHQVVSENQAEINESQVSVSEKAGVKEKSSSGKENIPLCDGTARSDSTDLSPTVNASEEKPLELDDNVPLIMNENNNEIKENKMDVFDVEKVELKEPTQLTEDDSEPADKELQSADSEVPEKSVPAIRDETEDPIQAEVLEPQTADQINNQESQPVCKEVTDTEEAEKHSPEAVKPQPAEHKINDEPDLKPESKLTARVISFNFDDTITISEKGESLGNQSDAASDTDSALGSASSLKDMKEENFFPGDILWGSFSRVSWYPCMVYPDVDGNIINANAGKGKQIHVKYFNWNGFTAHLPIKNVFKLKSIDDFWQQIVDLKMKKSKVKPFAKSCYKAIEEANFFKKYATDERIQIFDEILSVQLSKKARHASVEKIHASEVEEKPSTSVKPVKPERKSIDSALSCSVSPTPSSPHDDDLAMKADPIEIYLQSMMQYEANRPDDSKQSRRHAIKTEVVLAESGDSSNRRKSVRAVKKRKFEDFEEVGLIDGDSRPSSTSEAAVEQKAKRPRVVQEETLEDRFAVDLKLLRSKFRNFSKKRVCMECHEMTNEQTFRCNGNEPIKCSGWFHQKCSGHFEQKREEIRHIAGDSEEIIQTQAIKTTMLCKPCNSGVKKCFVCSENVDMDDNIETQHCLNQECRLTFHKSCLKLWPQNKISKGNNTSNNKKNNLCPQHTCHSCFYKDIHKSGTLAKCMKCPAAYHTELTCIPAGTVFLSQTQIICPRHPSEKENSRNTKENLKPLNVDFCNLCPDGGNLVCCDSCPNAFHYDCIGYEETDENFICQECREGRLPLYNTIVWARVGSYRWWPALVMHDFSVPMKVLKTQKFDREFCVRFFGSYDFFYTTCERVLMYDGSNLSVKTGSSRLDSAFNLALEEAHQMAQLLDVEDADNSNAKPKPYTKIIQNRPIAPVKMKKVDEHTQGTCNCSTEDANPCGRNSDCINMHINFECDGETCPAKEKCQNQKMRKREYAEVKVVKTQTRGFGVISVKDIPEDTFIIEYVGELIDSNEFNRRMKQKIKNKEKEFYFLTIEGDLYVDAEPAGNLARFINHSCDPNCDTRKLTVDGNTRIGIFSNQPIKAGTELTFDYQMEFVDNKKTACFCGSTKCSGLIGDKPIDPEKKVNTLVKRKPKRKHSGVKIHLPEPKRKRTIRDTIDPFAAMLKRKLGGSSSMDDKEHKEEEGKGEEETQEPVQEETATTASQASPEAAMIDMQKSSVELASPFEFHVAGDSHQEEEL